MITVKKSAKGYVVELDSYNAHVGCCIQGLMDGRRILVSDDFAARVGIPPQGKTWDSRYPGSGVLTYADDLYEAIQLELADPNFGGLRLLARGSVCR